MSINRKQATQDYKDAKIPRGIYVARCLATDRVWVDSSRNLAATKNSFWFFLRAGNHKNISLQDDYNALGADAIQYEVLEQLDDDTPTTAVTDLLKEKKLLWAEQLKAKLLYP